MPHIEGFEASFVCQWHKYFLFGDNFDQLLKAINSEMCKLKIWLDSNKLSLNLNKTKLMLFGRREVGAQVQVHIDGVNTELQTAQIMY